MDAFRARFRERCRTEALRLASGPDAERRAIAHRIAGMAGTLGYPELSALARRIDDAYAAGDQPSAAAVASLLQAVRDLPD